MRSSILQQILLLALVGSLSVGGSNATAAPDLTRRMLFDYDPASGRLTKEATEPGTAELCLVQAYRYDVYGNKSQATSRNCNGSSGVFKGSPAEAASPRPDDLATI